jgi:Leucine-rich repeat (LRR) protein
MSSEKLWLSYNHLFNLFFIVFFSQSTCLHSQLCTQEQTSSLLQFKQLFSFNQSVSADCDVMGTPSYPKMKSWKMGSDCCSWDGVKCDNTTGQVIGLDLSCSCLQGIIHPNSSLFRYFPYLQTINLAWNDFAMSRIPSAFSQFTRLTHLNLSSSNFYGEVPIETAFLNKLVSLDLSANTGLSLDKDGFQILIQNLTEIRVLDLGVVNISMVVPNSLLNRTCIRILRLNEVGLQGEFPNGMFQLPHLQELDVRYNEVLTGTHGKKEAIS